MASRVMINLKMGANLNFLMIPRVMTNHCSGFANARYKTHVRLEINKLM
jgi:hypothetical protein